VRTLPLMRADKRHPTKIADGEDHYVIALAYYCLGAVGTSQEPTRHPQPRWMRPKRGLDRPLGSESIRPSARRWREFGT
jgi:hypothetical protein